MLKFNRVKKRHAFSTGETDDEEEAEKLAKVTKAFIIMSLIKMRHECTIILHGITFGIKLMSLTCTAEFFD